MLKIDYDEAGRMFHWYHDVPHKKYTKLVYDRTGQLTHFVNKDDKITIYTYYSCGYIDTINHPSWDDGTDPNKPGKQVKYHLYDFHGRVLTVEDSEIGTRISVYDEAGNIILRRDPGGFQLEFIYDNDNRLWKVEDSTNNFLLDLTLDSLGRPIILRDSNALDGSINFRYHYTKTVGIRTKVLNLYKMEIPNINMESIYDYDASNRLGTITHQWTDVGTQQIFSQVLMYRDDNLIREVTGDDANLFRYDGIKQLIYEQLDNCTTDFDKARNRLYRVNKNTTLDPDENEYTETNQIKEEKESLQATFSHDEIGNIDSISTPAETCNLFFDGTNRLRVYKKENENEEVRYTYDEAGRIVERVVEDLSSGAIETTKFNYLFTKPIVLERNGHQYMILTWDPRDMLLRVRRNQSYNAGWTYEHSLFSLYDGVGNIVRFMNSEKDETIKIRYNSWGGINVLNDPDSFFEFWGYKNGILDLDTDFVLFGERWYVPKIGRWISEDPSVMPTTKGYSNSNNLYHFVGNDPINYSDPSGLSEVPISTTKESTEYPLGIKTKIFGYGVELSFTGIATPEEFSLTSSFGIGYLAFSGKTGIISENGMELINESAAKLSVLKISQMHVGSTAKSSKVSMDILNLGVGIVLGFGIDVALVKHMDRPLSKAIYIGKNDYTNVEISVQLFHKKITRKIRVAP